MQSSYACPILSCITIPNNTCKVSSIQVNCNCLAGLYLVHFEFIRHKEQIFFREVSSEQAFNNSCLNCLVFLFSILKCDLTCFVLYTHTEQNIPSLLSFIGKKRGGERVEKRGGVRMRGRKEGRNGEKYFFLLSFRL